MIPEGGRRCQATSAGYGRSVLDSSLAGRHSPSQRLEASGRRLTQQGENMSEQSATSKAGAPPQNNTFALIVLATVFFAFGFATAFKDPLVHHLIGVFNLTHAEA